MRIRSGKDPFEFAFHSGLPTLCHGSHNELLQGLELLKRPSRQISAPDKCLQGIRPCLARYGLLSYAKSVTKPKHIPSHSHALSLPGLHGHAIGDALDRLRHGPFPARRGLGVGHIPRRTRRVLQCCSRLSDSFFGIA